MQALASLVAGLLFGIGLILAGMTDPSKVLGFLDLFGVWDPSLALVMAGAILVGACAFAFGGKRETSWLGAPKWVPDQRAVDRPLVLGSLAFGVGWGLAGFCPGPALASLASGGSKVAVFMLAMLTGMALFELLQRRTT
jgi:uncharacterized membrane protein YedE/YeeE